MENDLPPNLTMLARIVDGQTPDVRELFHYALVMLLVEDGKAQIIAQRTIDARQWLTIRTVAGELFSIVKPHVIDARLAELQEMAREVLREDHGEGTRLPNDPATR